MPNTIQRLLEQARDAVPGQRTVRLPWQEPTRGERVAGGLDVLADTAGEMGNRAADARLSTGDRAADLVQRTQDHLSDIQAAVGKQTNNARGRLSDVQERVSGQVGNVRQGTRALLRSAREQARSQATQVAETAEPAHSPMKDQLAPVSVTPASPLSLASAEDASTAANRATAAAARAERASGQALAASNQIAALLDRLLSVQIREGVPAETPVEGPSDIQIRFGEGAESPLTRAADTVARAVAAAGETIYDYSGGHYGLAPRDARELRREREKERAEARPVTIIEGHYAGEKQSRSRLPLLIAGLLVAAGLAGLAGFWFMQRRSQSSQIGAGEGRPMRAPFSAAPPAATPAFDRVVRGELLPTPSGASAAATAATGQVAGGTRTVAETPPSMAHSPDIETPTTASDIGSGMRTFSAGEPADTQTGSQAGTSRSDV